MLADDLCKLTTLIGLVGCQLGGVVLYDLHVICYSFVGCINP